MSRDTNTTRNSFIPFCHSRYCHLGNVSGRLPYCFSFSQTVATEPIPLFLPSLLFVSAEEEEEDVVCLNSEHVKAQPAVCDAAEDFFKFSASNLYRKYQIIIFTEINLIDEFLVV